VKPHTLQNPLFCVRRQPTANGASYICPAWPGAVCWRWC